MLTKVTLQRRLQGIMADIRIAKQPDVPFQRDYQAMLENAFTESSARAEKALNALEVLAQEISNTERIG